MSVFVESSQKRLPPELKGSTQLYEELADLIVRTLEEAIAQHNFTRCSAIGISTPGIVNLRTGQLALSVTLPEGSNIPRELARRLVLRRSQAVQKAFKSDADSEHALAKLIYVDNDIRCIARHELSTHGWKQFACVYAGSGVGGALVADGKVHFGSHASAGHVGHLELEAARAGSLPLWTGQQVGPTLCDCGRSGFHLEPFANYAGLERITEAIVTETGRPILVRLRDAFVDAGHDRVDFYHSGFPEIIASADGRVSQKLPESMRAIIAENPYIVELANSVLRAYVGILASGIVSLSHIFDPAIVVLCGPLIEKLRENDLFAKNLRDRLPRHLLNTSTRPEIHSARSEEAQWQGAGLISWDATYHLRRDGAPTES